MSFVLDTTWLSIIVQFVTGLLDIHGISIKLPPEHAVLIDVLKLETFVQVVEFIFYIWFVYRFNLETMASTRYFDWVVTTPIMLFTSMVYFKYEELKAGGKSAELSITSFLKDYRNQVITVVISNFLMLLFGYLGEIGILNKAIAGSLGFVFFGISFYIIYTDFAAASTIGKRMFALLFVIWAIYGVAFMFPVEQKNITFNGLDIIAKNFFGIYLYFLVLSLRK
jgi:bacteriorhodopsin